MSPPRSARRRFAQLDVFADRPQRGNPLAVVLDADGTFRVGGDTVLTAEGTIPA